MKLDGLIRNISNIPGWRTNRRIVVIESDDWGSIRMPSRKNFNTLKSQGIDLTSGDALRYNLYDNLATEEDLSALFETLNSFKDKNDNAVVFTPISLVANPIFEKIKASNYAEYYYESFKETLTRFPGCEKSFSLWKEGIDKRLFVPQFHGREHLNVQVWMKALQSADRDTLLAFDHGCWGFKNQHINNITYQAAFGLNDPSELAYQKQIIVEGLELFEKLFAYKASYFVPPNGAINNSLEATAAEKEIEYMSAAKIQHEALGNNQTRRVFHYLGQKNKYGQNYITRNCFFEPNQDGKDWNDACLKDISIAFKMKKPAVISSHRANYIGAIDPKNRQNGLLQLNKLLKHIISKWPDVEFLTSAELGMLVSKRKKKDSIF